MIKYIFIDLDNTLYEYSSCHVYALSSSINFLAKKTGISTRDLRDHYDQARMKVKDTLNKSASSHSRLLYFKKMLEHILGETHATLSLQSENIYWMNYFTKMSLFPYAKQFLEKSKNLNIRNVILTNLNTEIQLRKINYLKITQYIDFIITSEEVGHDKPHKVFNDHIMKHFRTEDDLSNSWYVGDDLNTDLEQANLMGAKTFIKKNNNCNHTSPDYILFEDFKFLVDSLEKLGKV